ncbi:MAG: RNA polymerase sigma factor [Clostridia bacterium]|nr:RNA polymerase sigma factor [Clostridia bacterium]
MNDTDIIKLCQLGDQEGFNLLFHKYGPMALGTAYLICGQKQMAEDITQEAFVQCFREIKNLRNPDAFKSWFYKTVVRLSWRMCSKNKDKVSFEDISPHIQDTFNMNSDIESKDEKAALNKAMEKLNKKLRTVVVLYYFNHMSTREIAKTLGCFQGTVKSRLSSARKLLYKELRKQVEPDYYRSEYKEKECNA